MTPYGSYVMFSGEIGWIVSGFLVVMYPTSLGLEMGYYFEPSASAMAKTIFKQSSSWILIVPFEH
jgi:hypothetical protein